MPLVRFARSVVCVVLLSMLGRGGLVLEGAEEGPPRKIVLIAGPKSHGPVGNGIHDYPWSVKLLKVMLDNSNVAGRVAVEYHLDGWPKDDRTLDSADTIMVISDGRDGDLYEEMPPLQSPERVARIQKQIDRGCGFLTFHFSTFAPDQYAPQVLDWTGAYFDWEENGQKKWYSAIQTQETKVELPHGEHPVCRGVRPFSMKEEFYYNLRFGEVTPLLAVPSLPGRDGDGRYVAWARERKNGGRGFGTTCGHFYDNWRNDDFRRLILNAICWTAQVDVPETGVAGKFYTHAEITAALSGKQGTERAAVDDQPIRVLLLAGNDAHKWHNWEKTTPVIEAQLEKDPRVRVDVTTDPEAAFRSLGEKYDVLVQNSYANWHDKTPLSNEARTGLVRFLENGGGLLVVHFGNGAWNFSLPMAGESDWPEYRKIVRRVWNHHGQGEAQSGHDAFGRFSVSPTALPHEITRGLKPFEIEDELYFRQDGSEPVEPLITASSKVTKRDEPLAWTYGYGKGRVFQTLLGHSEKTYGAFEPCEMLRRGVAWAARRKVIEFDPQSAPPAAAPVAPPAAASAPVPQRLSLGEGKFGKGLDARTGALYLPASDAMRSAPVSVGCWTRLENKSGFNILVASEPKSSATHWELYSYAGSGVFSVYMPGRGGEYKTAVDIADGGWHHVGMVFETQRLRLYVDGKLALDRPLPEPVKASTAGAIAVGRLVEKGIGCAGFLDDLTIRAGAHPFEAVPSEAAKADDQTLGLWPFDELTEQGTSPDRSAGKRDAAAKPAVSALEEAKQKAAAAALPAKPSHWGKEAVGFDWTEQDSVDNRWQQTDIGPFLAYTVPLPEGAVRKGLAMKLGGGWSAADASSSTLKAVALYDTQQMQLRGIWSGGFLKFDPARYGIIGMPKIDGALQFSTREGPAWSIVSGEKTAAGASAIQYLGMSDRAEGPLLRFRVGATPVTEQTTAAGTNEQPVLVRTITLEPHALPFELALFDAPGARPESSREGATLRLGIDQRDRRLALAVRAPAGLEPIVAAGEKTTRLGLRIPAATERQTIAIAYASHLASPPGEDAALARALVPPPSGSTAPAPPRWGEGLVTVGKLGPDRQGFALDTLALPFDNPWKALLFTTGVGFFDRTGDAQGKPGQPDLALCTVHGDVWTVSGVDADLKSLRWRRFATGLYQPLGLVIVGNEIYVLGRDQITRLRDTDRNGEADEYDCVNNLYETSAGGHDYVACLERDPADNFYLVHATQGVLRASGDGRALDVVAAGLRNPNGMGLAMIDGKPVLTAAPQEGEWTPGSALYLVRPGEHYGYPGPRDRKGTVTPTLALEEPLSKLGVEAPFCWIPRRTDNSCGGQTWIDPDHWGNLGRHWLHHSFGQCTTMLVVPEGHFPDRQGATVPLPLTFDSGICRGRFRAEDGHLYVVGLRGWVTSATQDGCLQRVRRTETPTSLPTAWKAFRNGLEIRFAAPLDRALAQDPGSYHVEAWNYRYSAAYGSPDWKVFEESQEGHDELRVRSATLLAPDRVFLEIESLPAACQITVQYALARTSGEPIENTLAATLHRVPDVTVDPASLNRERSPGQLAAEEEQRLRPGVLVRWQQGNRRDTERRRMANLVSLPGEPPTPFLEPGPASAVLEGLLKISLRGRYQFRIAGAVAGATLELNGQRLPLQADAAGTSASTETAVPLHAGYNRLRLQLPESEHPAVRLMWSSAEFAEEPVPPTALWCDGEEAGLVQSDLLRRGRDLYLDRMCARCHAGPASPSAPLEMHEIAATLKERGRQIQFQWIREFLRGAPASTSPHRRMPRLFDVSQPVDKVEHEYLSLMVRYRWARAEKESTSSGSAEQGRVLYEDLGCLACHRLNDDEEGDSRRSLARLDEKFYFDGLIDYLQSPHREHSWSRMPDFRMTASEAADLAALLLPQGRGRIEDGPKVDLNGDSPRKGKEGFEFLDVWRFRGCNRCHDQQKEEDRVTDPRQPVAIRDVTKGCLAGLPTRPSEWGQIPDYGFSAEDRAALTAFLSANGEKTLARDTAVDTARRLVKRLDCQACHSRDSAVSPRGGLIAEESDRGLAPETLPTLTWAGEKLHTDWVAGLLAGKHPQRTRPWLKARMPAFPAYAEAIARGLAAEHGFAASSSAAMKPGDAALAELGIRLVDKEALDCRQCHGLGDKPPTGDAKTLLAPGINFTLVPHRIQPEYFSRFTLDPPRFDVTTRMPKLAIDGRTTKVTQILEGDARKQFAAIWAYLTQPAP